MQLAHDFNVLCENEFPARQMAEYVAKRNADAAEDQRRRNAILTTKYVCL